MLNLMITMVINVTESLQFANSSLDFAECPLTLSAQLEGCADLIKVLKNGGAHLDFRTKDGITALHKAVRSKNHTALIVRTMHHYFYYPTNNLDCLKNI